jgi:hypothetical protein
MAEHRAKENLQAAIAPYIIKSSPDDITITDATLLNFNCCSQAGQVVDQQFGRTGGPGR